jgi:hypothetical protein
MKVAVPLPDDVTVAERGKPGAATLYVITCWVLTRRPVRVTNAGVPAQTEATVTVPSVGCGLILTLVEPKAVQPFESVTVTL